MKQTWIVWIGIAAGTAACAAPSHKPADAPAARVATAPAAVTELASSVEAGGIVRARVTALIASRVMAPIVSVHVRAGDRVRRGDVLVTLDARDLRANDARAQASSVSAAEAVRAAQADVQATESALALARLMRDRVAALQQNRSATTEELDRATTALAGAEAQHTAAAARLAAATAGRDAANAAALQASVTTTYATLTAPFDGIVAERSAEPGSMASPGTPLLTLEDPTIYRLEVRLDEARAALIPSGADVSIQLDSGDTAIVGRVVETARIDPASHSFLVKIDLPAGLAARSGQFGRAVFSGPPRRAVTVPASAVFQRGQLTFVFVVDADQRVRLRAVSAGSTAGDRVEVLAGLREGEHVVTSPGTTLGDGDAVVGGRP